MSVTVASRTTTKMRVIPLSQAGGLREVGGKASRLGALMASGEHVPDGFCVVGGGEGAIAAALEAYRSMGAATPVAVRSSASAEDGGEASFAGQFTTVLGVRGEEELEAALKECWESLGADRVLAYLDRRGLNALAETLTMSVLIQRMVPARAAGVAFSADPLTGARDVVVVHAVRGLADQLVSGEVSPDRYRVAPDGKVETRPAGGSPALSNDEANRVAAMVRRIADASGTPQDIEWAIDDEGLWLLQARPMTALPAAVSWLGPVAGAKWIKDVQAGEWATEPLSPLGSTTTFEAMTRARETYRGWPPIPKSYEPGHAVINGWLYMRLGGPIRSVVANIAAFMATILTVGLDGHRRVRNRWGPRLSELDELSRTRLDDMNPAALRQRADRLLDALGWWWIEVSFFASLVRVGQQMVGRRPDLPDPGVLFRGNDSELLVSERALRRATSGPEALAAYVRQFGHAVDSADPIHPTLAESPNVQAWQVAAARADQDGPDERLARLREKRAKAEEVVKSIKGPRGFFARRVMATGQSHAAHTDDAVFHLQRVLALVRATFLAQGAALVAAGVLAKPEDVFYLRRDELWAASGDVRGAVEARRAVRDEQKKLSPPALIPPPGDPSWANDRMMKMLPSEMREQLLERGMQERDGRSVVVGTPASPGSAKGIARVIAGPEDFGRFMPGDVLVAHATSPMWTPLLAIAAAAVTEVGGPFAHAAIVAREFGIPLVDGALDATKVITDGAPILVNGSTGVVEL